MDKLFDWRGTCAGLAIAVALMLGCTQSDTPAPSSTGSNVPATNGTGTPVHDPDDVPITEADVDMPADYAAAMPRINEYRDSIRSAIDAGTPSKAHRPLDELDIVLNKLPKIASDSDVPRDQWEEVNTASRELRDLFNTLHASIDAGQPPDYPAVADDIEETIARLEAVTAAPADTTAPDDSAEPEESEEQP
jgi:hypothetical protein